MTPTTPDPDGWQRLDPRMLLIGPVQTLRQFAVPVVIALLGISGSQGSFEPLMAIPLVLVPIALGFVPWLTTRYRVTETQFQQRKGLLNRKQLTAPLDRVRSVDLEASLMHRLLGLAKVQIGTGVDETRIELDSLAVAQAEELRRFLLGRAGTAVLDQSAAKRDTDLPFVTNGGPGGAQGEAPDGQPWDPTTPAGMPQPAGPPIPAYDVTPPQVLARIDWSWLRFAPFSLSRLALVAGAIGALSQFGESLPFLNTIESAWRWLQAFAIPLVILWVTVGALIGWVAVSVAGYVIQWWGLQLTRERGTLRLRSGLITSRSTTVEESRVRGVELTEPVLLRWVNGGELSTLATGVGSGGTTKVLPPCPREVCTEVGRTILGDTEPLRLPLVSHGAAALRRCHVRHQWTTVGATVGAVAAVVALDWPWWLPIPVAAVFAAMGVLTARAAYAHLGHLLTRDHLAAGDASVARKRTVLERDGVIGWVIQQSFFQRRRGLATLVATTAAGGERITVRDVPLARAVALALATTPTAVTPFLRT